MRKKLGSRKLWFAIASAVLIVLTEGLGWDVDPQMYWGVVGIAASYIIGQGIVDSRGK